MKIKSITIVTGQGVKEYISSEFQYIERSTYTVTGDPYECFKVYETGSDAIKHEIRCLHLLDIEYEHETL